MNQNNEFVIDPRQQIVLLFPGWFKYLLLFQLINFYTHLYFLTSDWSLLPVCNSQYRWTESHALDTFIISSRKQWLILFFVLLSWKVRCYIYYSDISSHFPRAVRDYQPLFELAFRVRVDFICYSFLTRLLFCEALLNLVIVLYEESLKLSRMQMRWEQKRHRCVNVCGFTDPGLQLQLWSLHEHPEADGQASGAGGRQRQGAGGAAVPPLPGHCRRWWAFTFIILKDKRRHTC